MRTQKLISAGFAIVALASASLPALAWTVWPDVDFEWYANVGRTYERDPVVAVMPTREGYIWAPAHWETRGIHQNKVAGQFVRDDYAEQLALYNSPTVIGYSETIIR